MEEQNFIKDRRGRVGEGADLNVLFTLSGEKVKIQLIPLHNGHLGEEESAHYREV